MYSIIELYFAPFYLELEDSRSLGNLDPHECNKGLWVSYPIFEPSKNATQPETPHSFSEQQGLVCLVLPREPQAHTLPSDLAAPKAVLATFPPFLARALLTEPTASTAASGLCKDDLKITLL